MSKSRTKLLRMWTVWAVVAAGFVFLPGGAARSQDTTPMAAAATESQAAETPAAVDPPPPATLPPAAEAESPAVLPPAGPATAVGTERVGGDVPSHQSDLPAGATEESLSEKALAETGVASQGEAAKGWSIPVLIVLLAALFILPVLAGSYLARAWKMPDHGWKISLVLGMLAGSVVICAFGEFKYGPDLAGGITLIYELADADTVAPPTAQTPRGQGARGERQIRSGGREFSISEMIATLKMRLDPTGTKEITVREYGPAVEIIIPQTGQSEMEYVKRRITDMGLLEFRITADNTRQKDRPIILLAKELPPGVKDVRQGDTKVAEWVAYDVAAFRDDTSLVTRKAGDTPEALVLMDAYNVTGDYLSSATKGLDERGGPAVHFSFNRAGSMLFGRLTGDNVPSRATPDVYRHLGIILDKHLLSAPRIITKITDRGMISGGAMTEREVDHIIEVLKAGSLPAALNKTPISEEIISPTLGGVTVQKGKTAITASLIGVMLFMLVYYRFAGIVACVAVTFNLLLVLALMVLIKAAFTLPGLAGLALTVGMSVDANVLIYERIREELRSGAALRMAIRNGFGRAMSAIVDSNLTTIISGIALFYIGTDQVKGFAVTLILGILTSMFTAIFFARLVFDVAERRGWIRQIRMMQLFSQPNFDFLRIRWAAIGASLVVIAIGMAAVYFRGTQLLDIDFTGGSSVTFSLNDADRMPLADVRKALNETPLADKNLLIVERGTTNTSYTVDTSEQSVETVKEVIGKEFGDRLKKYSFQFSNLRPITEGGFSGVEATLAINAGPAYVEEGGVSYDALHELLHNALEKAGHGGVEPVLTNPSYHRGSSIRYNEWSVRFAGLDESVVRDVLQQLQREMNSTPLFPLANNIGGRVSTNMQIQAFYAISISILAMIVYLWLRFQKPAYGIAAAVALLHDVLITIGMMALSAYVVSAVPGVARALRLDAFQINLTIIAALLTIIGYSVNDTIVTFDRLREIKGKSQRLTAEMINASVNQTLGRTVLTVLTVFIVVVILYFFGGEGLHSFAFAFLVGIVAGTYSSVYIAAPVLLWLSGSPAPAVESKAAAYGGKPSPRPAQ